MRITMQGLTAWQLQVRTNLIQLGVPEESVTNMKGADARAFKDIMQDLFHGNYNESITQHALPISHPAIQGPLNVARHLKEVFFE
jgi:hypothetical protein